MKNEPEKKAKRRSNPSFSIGDELHARIKAAADAEDRPVSQWVRRELEAILAKRKPEKPPETTRRSFPAKPAAAKRANFPGGDRR